MFFEIPHLEGNEAQLLKHDFFLPGCYLVMKEIYFGNLSSVKLSLWPKLGEKSRKAVGSVLCISSIGLSLIQYHHFWFWQTSHSYVQVCVLSCFSRVRLFVTLWIIACQAPLSMGLSRQEWILGWVAMPYSRGISQPRDQTWASCVSCIGRQVLYHYHHLGSPTLMIAHNNSASPHSLWYLSAKSHLACILQVPGRVLMAGLGPNGGGEPLGCPHEWGWVTQSPLLSVPHVLLISSSENITHHDALLWLKHWTRFFLYICLKIFFNLLWCRGLVAPWYIESFQTRDGTHALCTGRWILNHLTTRGVLF